MSELVTGEAVALDLRTAAVPSRGLAAALDTVLQVVVLIAVGLLVEFSTGDLSEAAEQALGVLALVLVFLVLPVAVETVLRGRTPGKAMMGLRVVRDDGGPIGFRQAFVRGLAGAFLEKFGITFYVLAVVVMLLHPRNKRMGDLLAGTVVVQERVPARDAAGVVMPPQLAGWASTLELSRLPDALALSVRSFVSRAGDLTDAAREDLGGRLVDAVREVTAPPPPPGTPGWAFLAAVLAERRRRETARLQPAGPGSHGPSGQPPHGPSGQPPPGPYPPPAPPGPYPPPPPSGSGGTRRLEQARRPTRRPRRQARSRPTRRLPGQAASPCPPEPSRPPAWRLRPALLGRRDLPAAPRRHGDGAPLVRCRPDSWRTLCLSTRRSPACSR